MQLGVHAVRHQAVANARRLVRVGVRREHGRPLRPAALCEEQGGGNVNVAVGGAVLGVLADVEVAGAALAHLPLHQAVLVAEREEELQQPV